MLANAWGFLDAFGPQAEALGWQTHELFGVHPTHGTTRVDHCGAIVLVVGGPVRAITDDHHQVRARHVLLPTARSCRGSDLGGAPMIATADRFGPWRNGLGDAERLARLRCMRTVAPLVLGPRGEAFAGALRQAESDPDHLSAALRALDALAPIERRQVLASFARIHHPAA